MDDSFPVGCVERIGKLNAPIQQAIKRHRAGSQTTVQSFALQ